MVLVSRVRYRGNLPGDLKFLKNLTSATRETGKRNAVLMGRVTWETIPEKFQPLPGRLNVVISRNEEYQVPDGVLLAHSLEDAIKVAAAQDDVETLFVLGGAQIYTEAIKLKAVRRVYLTRVHSKFECDAHFPEIIEKTFKLVVSTRRHEHKGLGYVFHTWERRR